MDRSDGDGPHASAVRVAHGGLAHSREYAVRQHQSRERNVQYHRSPEGTCNAFLSIQDLDVRGHLLLPFPVSSIGCVTRFTCKPEWPISSATCATTSQMVSLSALM